ncbi:MAG TPA: hypothetical protein VE196_09195, partial [Pseudonocardiaceae bacterium]|nr:hypothetical protein [Pseudonocardiaceae bacterium]
MAAATGTTGPRIGLHDHGGGKRPTAEESSRSGPPDATGSAPLPVTVILLASAAFAALIALLIQRPVITTEPVYGTMNAALVITMVTLGTGLVLQGQRFTGASFVLAGYSWLLVAADIYSGWGGWIAFVFGAGAPFYTPLSWGVLRYGRPALVHRAERIFLPVCAVVTSGLGAAQSLFSEPAWE